jgi:hypothetical protein
VKRTIALVDDDRERACRALRDARAVIDRDRSRPQMSRCGGRAEEGYRENGAELRHS